MPFWFAIIAIAMFVLSTLLMKAPSQKPAAKPSLPDIDENKPIPVVWGDCIIKAPQLVWWGEFVAKPILKFNFLTFKNDKLGYRYYIGMALGLCHGPVDLMHEIQINEKPVWTGGTSGAYSDLIYIDLPTLFGDKNVEGGIRARFDYYSGAYGGAANYTPLPNPYLDTQIDLVAPWKGLAYVVWRGYSDSTAAELASKIGVGWIGNAANLWPIWFKVRRQPAVLVAASANLYYRVNSDVPGTVGVDANPAEVLAEILTNTMWGESVPLGELDLASWQAAAQTLYTEGNGFSYVWDQSSSYEQMIEIILKQTDAVIYTDLTTGLIVLKLARADYDVTMLLSLTNNDFVEIEECGRGAWTDTANQVRVNYENRADNFKEAQAIDSSIANHKIQQERVAVDLYYPGCKSSRLAQVLARRDIVAMTLPLLKLRATTKRSGAQLKPASVFGFSWPEQGYTDVVMRVGDLGLGTTVKGGIKVNCIEDVFGMHYGSMAASTSVWSNPATSPIVSPNVIALEVPYWLQRDSLMRFLGMASSPPSVSHTNWDYLVGPQAGVAPQNLEEDSSVEFAPTGTLAQSYSHLTAAIDAGGTLRIGSLVDLARILPATAAEVRRGANLCYIGAGGAAGEFIAFETYTDLGGGVIQLNNVWRGLLDTVPQKHAAGARIWFGSYGFGITDTDYTAPLYYVNQHLTKTAYGRITEAQAADIVTQAQLRAARPLCPANWTINGSATVATLPALATDIVLQWAFRDRLQQTEVIPQSDGSVGPEPGIVTRVEIYDGATLAVIRAVEVTANTWTYPAALQTTDGLQATLVFVLFSRQPGGMYSWQAQMRAMYRPTGAEPSTYPGFNIYAGGSTYVAPNPYNANSLGGLPVSSSAPPVSGQTLAVVGGQITGVAPGLINPMTAAGDLIVGGAAGAPLRLPIGATGQSPVVSGGALVYIDPAPTWVPMRSSVSVTTSSLANDAEATGTVALGKGFDLIRIIASAQARVRLYKTAAFRTADAARVFGTYAVEGSEHGIICDILLPTANLDWVLTDESKGRNADATVTNVVYYAIQNKSGATAAITVTFWRVETES